MTKTLEQLKSEAREKLNNLEVPELWAEDSYKALYKLTNTLIETAYNAGRKSRDEEVENLMMEIKVMGEYD